MSEVTSFRPQGAHALKPTFPDSFFEEFQKYLIFIKKFYREKKIQPFKVYIKPYGKVDFFHVF